MWDPRAIPDFSDRVVSLRAAAGRRDSDLAHIDRQIIVKARAGATPCHPSNPPPQFLLSSE